MLRVRWMDRFGKDHETMADAVRTWELTGPAEPEHGRPGTVIEAYRDKIGVLQLDPRDRIGSVLIDEVRG